MIRTVDAAAPGRTAELGCREIRVFPERWKPEPLTVERESLSLPASESEKAVAHVVNQSNGLDYRTKLIKW